LEFWGEEVKNGQNLDKNFEPQILKTKGRSSGEEKDTTDDDKSFCKKSKLTAMGQKVIFPEKEKKKSHFNF
jgi:hypothetical protein